MTEQKLPRAVVLTSQSIVWRKVHSHLANVREHEHPQRTIYHAGVPSDANVAWEVILAEINVGNNSAAFETERAVNHFQPELVFFVGLAGGIKDVKIGDVAISTKVYDFEAGKVLRDAFEIRPSVGNSSYRLEQRAKADARSDNWLGHLGGLVPFPLPHAVLGAIAAGEKVVADRESETARFIKNNYGDAIAIEMEGRGFLEAVRANAGVDAIVIRGISNLLDEKTVAEGQGSQESAATHAAAFLFEMLSKLNIPRREKVSANPSLGAEGFEAITPQAAPAPLSHNRSTGRKDERIKTASLERLYSVLTGSPSPLFWLGGGTAVKSGIPLSDGLVEKAVRWQHCRDKGLSFDDPRVVLRLSDWLPELRKQPWFGSKTLPEAFPQVIHHLLHPRENRREFFRRITDTAGVPASIG